jgi:hypothetical protein
MIEMTLLAMLLAYSIYITWQEAKIGYLKSRIEWRNADCATQVQTIEDLKAELAAAHTELARIKDIAESTLQSKGGRDDA